MLGPGAPRRLERDLVEDGRLEVDAPPPGRERWGYDDLAGHLRDLNGHRCLTLLPAACLSVRSRIIR